MNLSVFRNPLQKINERYLYVDNIIKNMDNNITNKYKENKNKLVTVITKLDSLSPLKTLSRGYCIAQKDDNIIKSVEDLKINEEIQLHLHDGRRTAKIID